MIKQLIIQQVRSIVNSGKSPTEFLYPPGDPGLFGPDSVVWKVHGDFMSMIMFKGGETIYMETNHVVNDDTHLAEKGHRLQAELFYDYIMSYKTNSL